MIYIMGGKTFMTKYINENPGKILKTQFVIVSSTIRKTGKFEKQVVNANNILLPSSDLIVDHDDYSINSKYGKKYIEQLKEHKVFFANLIKFALHKNKNIIFLCGENELKFNYLKIIQKFILDEFGYKVMNYKEANKKVDKNKAYVKSKEEIEKKVDKLIEKCRKKSDEKKLENEHTRKSLLKSSSKKELRKYLDKRNVPYSNDMSKYELRGLIEALY